MNTIFKRSFFVTTSLLAMLIMASSCEDRIGIQVTPEAPNADKTLYEIIMNDSELTDFVEVLNACNVPSKKNPGEIISVADSLFNTSRVYTVWAPGNGSFNKDSIIERIGKGYRDDVMNTFVFSHVANFVKAAKGTFDEDGDAILMLNDKKSVFSGSYKDEYFFAGSRLSSVNERAKNGMLHKLATVAKYEYNIWEYIRIYSQTSEMYKVDSLVNYLYSYNDTVFSEYKSIPGPIVNGAETYLDSVFDYENKLLSDFEGVSKLNDEDSTYTFYLPTNEVWDEVIEKAEKHFNYALNTKNVDTTLVDSLKFYNSRFNIFRYLTYSDNEQKYLLSPDSVIPAIYEFKRKRFLRSVIEDCVVASETKKLSNGTVKVIDKFPYTIFDLWHDTIRVEAEDQGLVDTELSDINLLKRYSVSEKEINKEAGTKISAQYITFGDDANSRTDLNYYIPNVKSATYRIALIFVPRNITNSKVDLSAYPEPKFQCVIKSWDPVKKQVNNRLSENNIIPAMDRIDTVYLSEPVTFPVCEYRLTDKVEEYTAKIQIKGNNNPKQNKNDNTIRLDAILLIPVEDAE